MNDDQGMDLFIDEEEEEMTLIFDLNGSISYANEKSVEIMGYFEEELLDMNITDILPPDQLEKIKEEVLEKYRSGDKEMIVHEAKFIDRNLKMRAVEISSSLITKDNNPSSIRMIARELSQMEKIPDEPSGIRETVKAAESTHQAPPGSAEDILIAFDMTGQIINVNEKGTEVLGYFEDELLDMHITDILPPDQAEKIKNEALTAGGKEVTVHEMTIIDRNLKMLPMEIRASAIFKDGKPSHISVAASDMVRPEKPIREPERVQSSEILKSESKPEKIQDDKYRLIAEAVKEIIITFDLEGKITYINERGTQTLGYSREELSEMAITDILNPEQLVILKKQILRKPVTRNRKVLFPEVRFRNRTSKPMNLEVTASLILKEGGKLSDILILARDLSRRKKMEKEILRVRKFESLSTLADGLVEDLNDSLTSIMGNIELAQMESDRVGKAYEKLSYAKEGCEKLKNLIRQFAIFSRGGIPSRETGSVAELIKNSASHAVTNPNIRCEFFMVTDLWPVAFHEEQMKHAFDHLIVNACEAMPSGGIIKIYAENMTGAAARKDAGLSMEDGDYVKISVQDQGSGISEEHLEKIFDPYFSTKKTDDRGLGLTSVYAIIRKHYGYIHVDSVPGTSTAFYIYLPASKKKTLKK
ncbi:PAS domain S-box protein [Desulfococcaceae bacterium HSG8]|nr:PAS domain S-box protein [Desulfococcaceae bacterium HSG8]